SSDVCRREIAGLELSLMVSRRPCSIGRMRTACSDRKIRHACLEVAIAACRYEAPIHVEHEMRLIPGAAAMRTRTGRHDLTVVDQRVIELDVRPLTPATDGVAVVAGPGEELVRKRAGDFLSADQIDDLKGALVRLSGRDETSGGREVRGVACA